MAEFTSKFRMGQLVMSHSACPMPGYPPRIPGIVTGLQADEYTGGSLVQVHWGVPDVDRLRCWYPEHNLYSAEEPAHG